MFCARQLLDKYTEQRHTGEKCGDGCDQGRGILVAGTKSDLLCYRFAVMVFGANPDVCLLCSHGESLVSS